MEFPSQKLCKLAAFLSVKGFAQDKQILVTALLPSMGN